MNPSWASPATVAPLQALYAWYSGNAGGGKTNGEGAAGRRVSAGSEPGYDVRHASGGPAVSGLSGLSSLFDGNSPAEVEAAMHRDAMRAAAAAAVQAAMGGVTARGEEMGGPALARKRRDAGARRGNEAESTFPH